MAPMNRFIVVAALFLAACNPAAQAPRPSVVLDTCRLPGVDVAVQCGTFEVWEDRARIHAELEARG